MYKCTQNIYSKYF